MARSLATIQKQIQDAAVQYYAAAGLTLDVTKWSRRNILRLWTFIIASVIVTLEQIQDLYYASIETLLSSGAPATANWLKKKALEFQYSATNPQILIISDTEVPHYSEIKEDLKIITRASVKTTLSNNVKIKVAKSEPPAALAAGELSAFINYIQDIGAAGIKYTCTSTNPDKIYIEADVYYRGQYSAVIFDYIQTSLNLFYKNLDFDGTVKLSDLEAAIRNTTGVTDVVLKNVKARKDSVSLSSATDLILDNAVISRAWQTDAGYIVEETTASNTLIDTLTLIPG